MIGESLFYQAVSSELGRDFLDDVQRVIDLLLEQPKLGRPVGHGMRRALLSRFPFSLIRRRVRRDPHCCRRTSQAAARLLAQAVSPVAVSGCLPDRGFHRSVAGRKSNLTPFRPNLTPFRSCLLG
jgi:hypothetical protein